MYLRVLWARCLFDSGYDLDRACSIVTWLMEDVLEALDPSFPKDPVSELLEWLASVGCHGHMEFRCILASLLTWKSHTNYEIHDQENG